MIELFKLHSMRYTEKEIEHRQRLKNGLKVSNKKVKGKQLMTDQELELLIAKRRIQLNYEEPYERT